MRLLSDTTLDSEKSLSQQTYEVLRAMILSGEIRPGERLGERELARRIQVSRTPLREAIRRLERDGLAVNKPGSGLHAMEFDPRAVSDVFEYREVLELHVCRMAAERIGAEGIRALHDIVDELAHYETQESLSVDQLREEMELGFRIHEVIAQEAGNPMICETLMQLYDRLRLLEWIDVLWIDKWPETRREHRELVAAVTQRDSARAVSIAQTHLTRCREDALKAVKAHYRETKSVLQSRPFVRMR